MRLDRLPGHVNLTYCTNIHAGERWPDIRASLDAHVPAIKAAVAPDCPLGIGLRLSGEAAASAREPEELSAFRDLKIAVAFNANIFQGVGMQRRSVSSHRLPIRGFKLHRQAGAG